MKLGLGLYQINDHNLTFAKQLGVTHIIAWTPLPAGDGYWEFDALLRLRKQIESYGMEMAGIENLPREHYDKIRHGLPGRDEQIANVCTTIRNMGKAGIPILGYDFNVVRVWGHYRNGSAGGGRGGAGLTSFDYELVKDAPLHELGPVGVEEMWDRFTYFLRRVVPVAEEANVRLGAHPDDPPAPELCGTARILSSVAGLQRMVDTVPSPCNAIEFCQGTVTEMAGVGPKVIDVIRHFAERDQIVYVHFRNIKGTFPKFDETFPDDGDVDFLEAMRTYKQAGFKGVLIPDHSPVVVGDEGGYRYRGISFALGYMRGLLQAVGA